jgi:putative addiction module component (TIGR02574 family)
MPGEGVTRLQIGRRRYHVRMVDRALLEQVRQLDDADRLELLGEIWDTLDADALPVTPEVADLIDKRIADADQDPGHSQPWSEVLADLRNRAH